MVLLSVAEYVKFLELYPTEAHLCVCASLVGFRSSAHGDCGFFCVVDLVVVVEFDGVIGFVTIDHLRHHVGHCCDVPFVQASQSSVFPSTPCRL